MSKIQYIGGLLKNILNKRISIFALINTKSKIHKSARICHHSKIYNSNIGAYSYIAPRSQIVNSSIGKFCSIASDCSIGLAAHTMENISTSPIFTTKKNSTKYSWVEHDEFNAMQEVFVGNDVWIGTKVIIMGGVKIGNGAILGAGTIVTKDVPDYAIAVGIPARVVKYRFNETLINKFLQIKWWELPEDELKKKISIFQKQDVSISDLELLEN